MKRTNREQAGQFGDELLEAAAAELTLIPNEPCWYRAAVYQPGMVVTYGQAMELDTALRRDVNTTRIVLEELGRLIPIAKETKIHTCLGYRSWTRYLADVVAPLRGLRLEPSARREIVGVLTDVGMSGRQVGATLNVDEKTVRLDKKGAENSAPADRTTPATVTGGDGKNYPAKRVPTIEPTKPTPVNIPPVKGKSNSRNQVNMMPNTLLALKGTVIGLEALFTGGFERTYTKELAAKDAKTLGECITQLTRIRTLLRDYGSDGQLQKVETGEAE